MSDALKRRDFLKQAAVAGVGLGLAGCAGAVATPATSPAGRLAVAVIGVNSRGLAHVDSLTHIPGVEVAAICDVEDRALAKGIKEAAKAQTNVPAGIKDFRKILDDKSIDAVSIATPDHWHAPMAILALAAGKHVYVEKPMSHNAREGELLVAAAAGSGRVLQMGAQRRSFPYLTQGIQAIHDGIIGKTYFGRTWYANGRASIGRGKPVPVPAGLDYDLWQGPAPREPYRSNRIPYNWHWFWTYGTGEALNNGTHEVDVCRWAMGLNFPTRVISNGGRYQFQDDWETPDTQMIGWDFAEGKSMTWEGRSCNKAPSEGLDRGVMIYGTEGSALLDSNSYIIYDKKGAVIKAHKGRVQVDATNTLSSTGADLDQVHMQNFIDCIRSGKEPNCPATEGHKSTALLHLGNIAWRVQRELICDPANGHIRNDPEAMQFWQRQYEPGWEPKV